MRPAWAATAPATSASCSWMIRTISIVGRRSMSRLASRAGPGSLVFVRLRYHSHSMPCSISTDSAGRVPRRSARALSRPRDRRHPRHSARRPAAGASRGSCASRPTRPESEAVDRRLFVEKLSSRRCATAWRSSSTSGWASGARSPRISACSGSSSTSRTTRPPGDREVGGGRRADLSSADHQHRHVVLDDPGSPPT